MFKIVFINVLLVISFLSNLHSEECKVEHEILYSIASIERHIKKEIGYPYIISFNNLSDFKLITAVLDDFEYKTFKNDNRSIDCLEESNCIAITERLILNDIKNLDLGAFQLCYKWHKLDTNVFFDLEKSYNKACNIINGHIKEKKDKSFKTIARYHSKTKNLNEKYASILKKRLEKNFPKYKN